MESGIIPLGVLITTALLWVLTIYQAHRLLHRFVAKYPGVASRRIPFAFSRFAHPEKVIYFFRREAREMLSGDLTLWKERQRFVRLILASVFIPLLVSVAMFLCVVLQLKQ